MSDYANTIKIIDDTSDKDYELVKSSNKNMTSSKLTALLCEYIRELDIGLYCSVEEQDIYNYTCLLSIFSHNMQKTWSFVVVRPKDLSLKTIGLIPTFVVNSRFNKDIEEVTEVIASTAFHINYIDKIISEHLMYLENNYMSYKMNYETNSIDFVAKINIPENSYICSLKDIPFSMNKLPTTYYGNNLVIIDGKVYSNKSIQSGTQLQIDTDKLFGIVEAMTIDDEDDKDFISSAILEPVDKEDSGIEWGKRLSDVATLSRDKDSEEICKILQSFSYDNIWISADWHLFTMNDKTGEIRQNAQSGQYLFNQMQMVTSNSLFLYLGDLADDEITGSDKHDEIKNTLRMMKGKYKILVLGNNDLMDEDYYKDCGFDYVVKQIKFKNLIFSHHPLDIPKGFINIHGHIHGYKDYKNCSYKGHIDVYPKLYNNSPISLSNLLTKIGSYEKEVKNTLQIDITVDDERIEDVNSLGEAVMTKQLIFDRFCRKYNISNMDEINYDDAGKPMIRGQYILDEKLDEYIKEDSLSEASAFSQHQDRLIIDKEYARGDEFSNHDNLNWYRFYLKAPIGPLDCPWYYVDSARLVTIDDVPSEFTDRLERQLANARAIASGEWEKTRDGDGNILSTDKLSKYLKEDTVIIFSENMLQSRLNENMSIQLNDVEQGKLITSGDLNQYRISDEELDLKRLEGQPVLEDAIITFPKDEHSAIINRLSSGQLCYTTRVSNELGKYRLGVKYKTPWGQTVAIKSINKQSHVIDHPFYDDLTTKQRYEIHKYSEKIDKPYELIGFQLINEFALNSYETNLEHFSYIFNFSFISDDNKVPVYIILTDSKTFVGRLIKKYQNSPYNHASICFDENMKKMYSFNINGFVAESFDQNYKNAQARYSIYVTFIDKDIVDTVLEQLKKMEDNIDKFKYNMAGLFGIVLNKPVRSDVGYFCSEFVAVILKTLGIEGKKDSSLTGPYDFVQYKKRLYHVQKGFIRNFDSKKLLEQTKNIYSKVHNNPLTETGRFNIKVDEDGVIIRLRTANNFMEEYDKAHKLLIEYEKSDNIEGMKHELAKLFYIIILADTRYIHGHNLVKKLLPASVKYAEKARAFAMNDFKKYLQVVMKKEPTFDFTEYYKYTSYGDESIKIDKNVIGLVKKILF